MTDRKAILVAGVLMCSCTAGIPRDATHLDEYRNEMARLDEEQASAPPATPLPREDPVPGGPTQPAAKDLPALWAAEETAVLDAFEDEFAVATEAAIQSAGKARGFSEVHVGLRAFLIEVRTTGMPLPEVRSKAIRLDDEDSSFEVSQVLGSSVIAIAEDLLVIVEGTDRERMYENAPLPALGHLTYKVTGTRSYQSLLGLRQAFVVVPIEDFDTSVATPRALLKKYAVSGVVSMAEFHNGTLVECSDMPAAVYERESTSIHTRFSNGSSALLGKSCAALFSRPVIATCEFPKAFVAIYERPEAFKGFDQAGCDEAKGTWRPREVP